LNISYILISKLCHGQFNLDGSSLPIEQSWYLFFLLLSSPLKICSFWIVVWELCIGCVFENRLLHLKSGSTKSVKNSSDCSVCCLSDPCIVYFLFIFYLPNISRRLIYFCRFSLNYFCWIFQYKWKFSFIKLDICLEIWMEIPQV